MFSSFRHYTKHVGHVTLCVVLLCGITLGSNEIDRQNSNGMSLEMYDTDDLDTALSELQSDQKLVLTPGIEYALAETTVTGKDDIEIDGGYTVRITDIDDLANKFEALNHGRAEDDEIVFFGDTPPGINEGQEYYVRSPTTDFFTVSATKTGPAVNISDNKGQLLFGMYHAKIVPSYSTYEYDHLLKLDDCEYFTIKNVTFDGKYDESGSVYVNGFKTGVGGGGKDGCLLILEDCSGTQTLDGVHVANNRGHDGTGALGTVEGFFSYAVHMNNCGTVNLKNCTASHTGYNAWRSGATDTVAYNYCRSENPHHRSIGESSNGDVPTKIEFKNCDFIRDKPRESRPGINDDNAYSLVGNIDVLGSTRMTNFLMRDCFADWRDAEYTGASWQFTGDSACLLLKIEGIENAKLENCEFRHDENSISSAFNDFTLKADDSLTVKNLNVDGCTFSGGIFFSVKNSPSTDLDTLQIRGSKIQVDGNFGQSAALTHVIYPNFVISGLAGGPANTTIDNLNDNGIGSVIRLYDEAMVTSGSNKWDWKCNDLIAKGEDAAGSYWFIRHLSPVTQSPQIGDMNQLGNSFQDDNEFENATVFEFSSSDTTSILD